MCGSYCLHVFTAIPEIKIRFNVGHVLSGSHAVRVIPRSHQTSSHYMLLTRMAWLLEDFEKVQSSGFPSPFMKFVAYPPMKLTHSLNGALDKEYITVHWIGIF